MSNVTIGLSPGGVTITPPPVTPTNANGITSVSWTGLSATVPISGTPGSVVPVGVSSLSFTADGRCLLRLQPDRPDGTCRRATGRRVGDDADDEPDWFGFRWCTGDPDRNGVSRRPRTSSAIPSSDRWTSSTGPPTSGRSVCRAIGNPGAGIATLTTTSLAPGAHTLTAVWSGGPTPAQTSDPVDFQVGTAPSVTTQPTNQTASAGAAATFTAAATGDPTPTVQWQVSTDGGKTFTDIAGATSSSYTTPATTAADNGNEYQAVFSNAAGPSATTNPATLTVIAASTTGYRVVASNGTVTTFGNAGNYGSESGALNAPIVGIAATPDNKGYWLVGADGGVFTFGDATFYGSEGGQHLNAHRRHRSNA